MNHFDEIEDSTEAMARIVIREAIDLIRKQGWVRGVLCSNDGFCIMGAIAIITPDWDKRDAALDFLRRETRSQFVTHWNDGIARNKAHVLKVLEHAYQQTLKQKKPRRSRHDRSSIYS